MYNFVKFLYFLSLFLSMSNLSFADKLYRYPNIFLLLTHLLYNISYLPDVKKYNYIQKIEVRTLTIHNAAQHRSHILIYWRSFSTISFLDKHCTPLWLQSYKTVFCMIKSLKIVKSFLHCTYSHIYNPNIIYLNSDSLHKSFYTHEKMSN